jgi:triacylglycerol lipase
MTSPSSRDLVVLLHGWWSARWFLWRISRRLRREGFAVANIGYPAVWTPFEEIVATILPRRLEPHRPGEFRRVHFVTHSMGSLVVRRFLERNRPPNLGRVVMFGPPNHGSELANFYARFAVCRWLAGPNLAALQTGPDGVASRLPAADFELGVIAGYHPLSPSWSPLPKPHDGMVTFLSTQLAGMTGHCVVPRTHTLLVWDRGAIDQAVSFLRDGRFENER